MNGFYNLGNIKNVLLCLPYTRLKEKELAGQSTQGQSVMVIEVVINLSSRQSFEGCRILKYTTEIPA